MELIKNIKIEGREEISNKIISKAVDNNNIDIFINGKKYGYNEIKYCQDELYGKIISIDNNDDFEIEFDDGIMIDKQSTISNVDLLIDIDKSPYYVRLYLNVNNKSYKYPENKINEGFIYIDDTKLYENTVKIYKIKDDTIKHKYITKKCKNIDVAEQKIYDKLKEDAMKIYGIYYNIDFNEAIKIIEEVINEINKN